MIIRSYRNPREYFEDWIRQKTLRQKLGVPLVGGLIWSKARVQWSTAGFSWKDTRRIQQLP